MSIQESAAGKPVNRREFVRESALAAVGLTLTAQLVRAENSNKNILNFNEKMEYRRLGRTGLMVSAVCLGGHWKRVETMVTAFADQQTWAKVGIEHPDFIKNREEVVSRCIDVGINYIDACVGCEVMAYTRALKGRREKMYLGYSWYEKEARNKDWRSAEKLLQSLDEGMKEAKLDYVDLWRITCYEQGGEHTFNEAEGIVEALFQAKKQGKARFTGVSSHDRHWLKMLIEEFPEQMDVIVTPYTAKSKVLPQDSLFDAVKKQDVGVLGIKPFASNSLFKGDSALNSSDAEEDNRRARLAIRNILNNPAITAPIPGLINVQQVDNVATAVQERRQLDVAEALHLEQANDEAWAKLPEDYQWLKKWEYV